MNKETKQILAKDVQAGHYYEGSEITHVRKWDEWIFIWSGLYLLDAKKKDDVITVEVYIPQTQTEELEVE